MIATEYHLEGFLAAAFFDMSGFLLFTNPYPKGTWEQKEWTKGWCDYKCAMIQKNPARIP
jgi:hypothetical protein